MGFSRQEYWRGLSFPPPGDLPDPGMEPVSLMSPALAFGSLPLAPPGKPKGPGCLATSQHLLQKEHLHWEEVGHGKRLIKKGLE